MCQHARNAPDWLLGEPVATAEERNDASGVPRLATQ